MAYGDDAAAAGMAVVDGAAADANTIDDLINQTRDYIAQRPGPALPVNKGGTGASTVSGARSNLGLGTVATESTVPISKGGTGATTASAARTALGLEKSLTSSGASGKVPEYNASGQIAVAAATSSGQAVSKAQLDALDGVSGSFEVGGSAVVQGNLIMGGHVYVPNSSAATSSYVNAYINGDGRLSKGASSERFKKFISDIDPLSLGHIFPVFKRFQMRQGDGVWRYGYTAEQIAANPDTEQFAIYTRHQEEDGTAPHLERDADGNPIPESIDFIGLLLAQVAQLNARVTELEAAQGA